MDYFAHGFWSYIFFHWIRTPMLAVVFGLLPDTMSWGIYLVYRMITEGGAGRPIITEVPAWVFVLYNISHSLIVVGVVILLILIIFGRVPIYIFAWPIAIVMDIFTHTRKFLPTPFLWPISEWRFPGISWATWKFMLINYTAIAIALIVIAYRKKKRRT
ncbi:MAG: hypothetical protein ABH871_05990 [Pseudomonadota bacterium]